MTDTVTTRKAKDVFASRQKFDEQKYISRPYLEGQYQRALDHNKGILIRGNSGSGKTWLTYNVLKSHGYDYETINLNRVASYGSINEYFKSEIGKVCDSLSESTEAGLDAGFANGNLQAERTYSIGHDYYIEYLKKIKKSENKQFIIFDNFETLIKNEDLIEELARLIVLTDDPDVMEYNIYPIIIGANSDIMQFFRKTNNINTISNRLIELPEIKGFTADQCNEFVYKGFRNLNISIKISDMSCVINEILKKTNGYPQNVCDLCYTIADLHISASKKELELKLLYEAAFEWMTTSFSMHYTYVHDEFESNFNDGNHDYNKILYVIACQEQKEFDKDKIYAELTTKFSSVSIGKIKVKKYLEALANDNNDNNLLTKTNENHYTVRNFKYSICLKSALTIEDDKVSLIAIEEL